MLKLNNSKFLKYKLLNSSFTGISIGMLFTIYGPLDPLVYSIGGTFSGSWNVNYCQVLRKITQYKELLLYLTNGRNNDVNHFD